MELTGSCHCRAVKFTVKSHTPVPYQHCYCTICRKTQGSAGAAINLAADNKTLKKEGETAVYHAVLDQGSGKASPAERHFCPKCGSHLWLYDSRWPDLIHPQASAIDSPLPKPRALVCLMMDSKPDWAVVPPDPPAEHFQGYPETSIEEWHKEHNVYVDDGDCTKGK